MTRAPEGLAFGATAAGITLITGAAFVLILYAALTFVDLLPTASAQALARLGY